MSGKASLLEFLLANVGKPLDSQTLREASGGAVEFGRRLRELRAEGWQIETHNDDRTLRPGQWVLRSDKKGKPVAFGRGVSREVRAIVLERNGYTCQKCGVAAGDIHPFNNRTVRLQMGHIVDKSAGGKDTVDNLRAECSVCNEGAQDIAPMPPPLKTLMVAVRRADIKTQEAIYRWLARRLKK